MTSTATSIELPPATESPTSARNFVANALRRHRVAPETVDVARLLTSELVTNAVLHARTTIIVSVRVTEQRVHIAVDDEDPSRPADGAVADLDTHGRGLTIVAGLARTWGVEPRGDGKSIWFELRTARA